MKPVPVALTTAFVSVLFTVGICAVVDAGQLSPRLEKLTQEEIGQWVGKVHPSARIDKAIIRRGLISDKSVLRADCAQYLATHGDLSDVPYLIDALSDQTQHVGARPLYSGMLTTRYWASVALTCITKIDLGYRWDDPDEMRKETVDRWVNYWESIRYEVPSVHTKAMGHSDFVFVCEVVEEGPLGHGNNSVQKSYLVRYPETLHHGLVGIDLPGEIWIHYDSTRYPDVPKSGFEATFHKGDSFIAFLDYVDKGQFLFQIVRVDKVGVKRQITKTIKSYRAKNHRPKDASGPDDAEFAKAVAQATSKLRATVEPSSDYKLIKAEMTWAKGKYVWLVTYKPRKLLPEDPSKGHIGAGGEVFITVDLKTGHTEVRHGE